MSELKVDFAGELIEVQPRDCLSFGREAELEVDSNPYLHRQVGVFRQHDGLWWLCNVGSEIAIELCDEASPSRMTVTPGAATPLPFQTAVVRFQAGQSVYELLVDQPDSTSFEPMLDLADCPPRGPGSSIPLNNEQRLLLVSLAELRLRDRCAPASAIPTNDAIIARLGWSRTKFNRKLDNLCVKFERLGVGGLKGDSYTLASNRRERLVEYVLTVGLITRLDLDLLESLDRRRAQAGKNASVQDR